VGAVTRLPVVDDDLATRDRLLTQAARLFAERGFNKVTVREISTAARANDAAVNYHYGDKMGLYAEVVERCLTVIEQTNAQAIAAGDGGDPETQLTAFIRVFVERLLTPRPDMQIQQLMMHEMADPTPMLERIARRVMRPRMNYLCKVIGALMDRPPADPTVVKAAASVQSQCLMAKMLPSMSRLNIGLDIGPDNAPDAADLAAHITRFSLAGIRELAQREHH
jgi:AcrR family transcriptional regulator